MAHCWAYVDGFNLYNGVRNRAKWIDLLALSRLVRKHDSIDHIKYFTAPVERRTDDPDKGNRQLTYWSALDTLGCVERIAGHFSTWEKRAPLSRSVATLKLLEGRGCNVTGVRPIMVDVLRSEEKGSDVNLAAHLVHDAHRGVFEAALIISSDTDLAGAIGIVTHEIKIPVYVCRPPCRGAPTLLRAAATSVFNLDKRWVMASLFPDPVIDALGNAIHKPPSW